MNVLKNKTGFSLVEILIAIAMFSIFSMGIFYLSLDTINQDSKIILSNEAMLYAQEGLEAARNIRDKNFLFLINGDHGLSFVGNVWNFGQAPELIDNFYERTVTVFDVYRDISGNINPDGTTFDPDTKRVESEVAWIQNGVIPRSIVLSTYLTNWRGRNWISKTCTDYNKGTFENTETVNLPAPPTDNCGIKLLEIENSSTFFSSTDIGKHGNDVDVDGNYAYLAADETNSGLHIVNVSNPSSPVTVSSKDINGKGNYIKKDGDYAYIGVDSSSKGLAIVNVSNPNSPSITSTTNLGAIGNMPEILGNYLYQAINQSSNSLKIYDITSKSSPTLFDTINFGDETHVVEINGNYAYVGTADDHSSLRILNILDPNNIQEISSLDVGEEINAITISGNTAFIGIESHNSSLKVIDISDPVHPSIITTVDTDGEIQDLTISGNYLYAAIDEDHSGLAAINIENPYSPHVAYHLDVSGKGTGIDSDSNYVYVSTDTANKGLVIVGTTVSGNETNGTYTSEIFDTGSSDTLFNSIDWTSEIGTSGAVKFQLRMADTSTNISSAVWTGPDGTNSTYYETPRTIITTNISATGTKYVQYKAFFDSDGSTTPILLSVHINYTP